MPRAEAGTTKAIANSMKAKGLQRLRWYCQVCEKQCRDENGFKCHVASESHTRKVLEVGQDSRKAINDFSGQFQRDFIQLLRTGHGEKSINANRFYNEYIGNKEHVHMNATKWNSLTEFCKEMGRQGIIRVSVDEKNEERGGASALMMSWIDNSPENLRRQEALKKKERQDKGDEYREQKRLEAEIRRAREARKQQLGEEIEEEVEPEETVDTQTEGIKRIDGAKIKLDFGAKKVESEKLPSPPLTDKAASTESNSQSPDPDTKAEESPAPIPEKSVQNALTVEEPAKVSIKPLSLGASKPKNVFAAAGKKNAFGGVKKAAPVMQQKPISEAERIMKEEIERKRQQELRGGGPNKRQRVT